MSVPDVFERADRLARREGRSRSEVYGTALREYVARHAPDEVTDAIDASMAALREDAVPGAFVRRATVTILESSEW